MATIRLTVGGRQVEITTERAESSYGQPVVVVDGQITDTPLALDGVRLDHECPSAMDILADAANVWGGPATRKALRALANEMAMGATGAECDRIIAEFQRRHAAEETTMIDREIERCAALAVERTGRVECREDRAKVIFATLAPERGWTCDEERKGEAEIRRRLR